MSVKKIPGPLTLPIWGNLYKYKFGLYSILKYQDVLEHLYKKYGPLVKEKYGNKTVIHVFDPDDAKTIYKNEGKLPRVIPLQETIRLYREKNSMSLGLGNLNGEEWYRLRKSVRHLMLLPKDVQHFLPKLNVLGDELTERILQDRDPNNCEVKHLRELLGKWAQESSGIICFDRRLGSLDRNDGEYQADAVLDANKTVFIMSAYLKFSLPIYKYITTPRWKKLVKAEDIVIENAKKHFEVTIKEIDEAIKQTGTLPKDSYNFLTTLLSKPDLSSKDVMAVTLSLYTDGLTTTLPSVMYNLYCLAVNPAVQEKAYNEIIRLIKPGQDVTASTINELSYVKNVVKETFRLYPIGTEISRITDKDMILSGYEIPKDTYIDINMNVHFKSSKYFKDPLSFIPERWIRREEADFIDPFILTPFGFGTRTCIGRRFAEQDLYLILAKILLRFRLVYPVDEPPLEQVYNTLLFPMRLLKIKFIDR
ncbi:putative cytochrome P450 CYP44 [Lycorma delicatula]|uniref:putative cytochrome P450 CYP44 n=1 Tax=Lycorma delicatula TaxID=130591 RepID=UPI003F510268